MEDTVLPFRADEAIEHESCGGTQDKQCTLLCCLATSLKRRQACRQEQELPARQEQCSTSLCENIAARLCVAGQTLRSLAVYA